MPGALQAEQRWASGVDLHRLWTPEEQRHPELAWWETRCVSQEAFLDRARPH
jgi:hypothetical protein